MATAVRLDARAKDRLERLQAEIKLRTGRRVTQQELLERLVAHGLEDREAIIASFEEPGLPLSDEEKARFFEGTGDLGFESSEEEIDVVLYGGRLHEVGS